MESTENSKNQLWISPELLDLLIREYQEASGTFLGAQDRLLQTDPDTVIVNLQRANGAGHILKVIMSKIPKEVINECPIRQSIFNSLFGTFSGGASSEGRRRSSSQDSGKQGRGSKRARTFWSGKSGNKSDPNRP